jgi:hypothetical protein
MYLKKLKDVQIFIETWHNHTRSKCSYSSTRVLEKIIN